VGAFIDGYQTWDWIAFTFTQDSWLFSSNNSTNSKDGKFNSRTESIFCDLNKKHDKIIFYKTTRSPLPRYSPSTITSCLILCQSCNTNNNTMCQYMTTICSCSHVRYAWRPCQASSVERYSPETCPIQGRPVIHSADACWPCELAAMLRDHHNVVLQHLALMGAPVSPPQGSQIRGSHERRVESDQPQTSQSATATRSQGTSTTEQPPSVPNNDETEHKSQDKEN